MSNPLPQRIQHLYIIRNMKKSYKEGKKKKKKVQWHSGCCSDFLQMVKDEEVCSYRKKKKRFRSYLLAFYSIYGIFGFGSRSLRENKKIY